MSGWVAVGAVFALVGWLALPRLRDRRATRRAREVAEYAEWRRWIDGMRNELQRRITVREAARLVNRPVSTIHSWINRGKLARVDGGGKGKRALVIVADVYAAEHSVRGKGRPPAGGRLA